MNEIENIGENKAITPEVKKNSALKEIYDWLQSITLAIFAFVIIFTFIARVTTVDGESMLQTLKDGQRLVVSALGYTPQYEDIIIIEANGIRNDDGTYGKPIVKRIIGLPGDTIRIDFENGIVYRNDSALEEDFTNTLTNRKGNMTQNQEVYVEEGTVFVLGDNRNNSKDSRFSEVGLVDQKYIMGKALFRIFPFNQIGSIY